MDDKIKHSEAMTTALKGFRNIISEANDALDRLRKRTKANETDEEAGRAASELMRGLTSTPAWIPTKHAVPVAEGEYNVILTTISHQGNKQQKTTANFKWVEIGDGRSIPHWDKGFDWTKVTHFKPKQ